MLLKTHKSLFDIVTWNTHDLPIDQAEKREIVFIEKSTAGVDNICSALLRSNRVLISKKSFREPMNEDHLFSFLGSQDDELTLSR